MNNLLTLLGNLFVFFAQAGVRLQARPRKKHDAENRIAAVRADPASAWLRKLGGTDRRFPPPLPTTPGAIITPDGLICLPPDEAGALLLWMEYAESNGSL